MMATPPSPPTGSGADPERDALGGFAQVRQGLKPGGRLVVIDFRKEADPVGPPVGMKLAAGQVADELRAALLL